MIDASTDPSPDLLALSSELRAQLAARGVLMERSAIPSGELTFLHPRAWQAAWKEDHVSILHGVPPRGWLTLYPVPVRQALHPAELLDAYLEEFVEPGTHDLELVSRRPLSRLPEVESAIIRVRVGSLQCQGLILARVALGQARVVSYWVDAPLFRPGPVEDLLLVILGGIEAPAGSRFAEQQASWSPLPAEALWPAVSPAQGAPFTSTQARFALRLAPGWQGQEVELEGSRGWLLLPPMSGPPDASPTTPSAKPSAPPLVVLSGADLHAPLEQALLQALQQLQSGGQWEVELPAEEIPAEDMAGAFALVQVHRGVSHAAPGQALRLWSLGCTEGVSIVHFFAMGEAEVLQRLIPDLAAMARTLRVLPRQLDHQTMRALAGVWRFLEAADQDSETVEHCLALSLDGLLRRSARSVDGRRAVLERPEVAGLLSEPPSGRWDVVDGLLTLYRSDTQREIFGIESLTDTSAILGGIWWERLG